MIFHYSFSRHLFWDLLPQIGSNTSVVFIRDLVKSGRVKGFLAQRLVSTFPFYLRHPTEELLFQCEVGFYVLFVVQIINQNGCLALL